MAENALRKKREAFRGIHAGRESDEEKEPVSGRKKLTFHWDFLTIGASAGRDLGGLEVFPPL